MDDDDDDDDDDDESNDDQVIQLLMHCLRHMPGVSYEHGANVDVADRRGRTPLMVAARNGQVEVRHRSIIWGG
jgi:ankyrin repeat protein